MLVKLYGADPEAERRYSPAQCMGAIPTVINGNPAPDHISTSFVERRTGPSRLSNGFSRKVENHMAAVALNYFAYQLLQIHTSLRVTSAMAAGVTTRLMDMLIWWLCWSSPNRKKPRSVQV